MKNKKFLKWYREYSGYDDIDDIEDASPEYLLEYIAYLEREIEPLQNIADLVCGRTLEIGDK